MAYESLISHVSALAVELGSLYQDTKPDRRAFIEFMNVNDWFGMKHTMIDKTAHMDTQDLSAITERLTLWLSAFKRNAREKAMLLLDYFSPIYPETCRLYNQFISDNKIMETPSAWKLLDFLFSEIDKEITEYNESDITTIIERLNGETTRKAARLFAQFLGTRKQDGETISDWTYAFGIRDTPDIANDAYPFDDFAYMACCVYSEEMWARHGLIEKAVQNKAYAEIWLFVALHFICALRSCDMKRLPAPALPYDGATTLKKITDGTFTNKEAAALVAEWEIRLKLNPLYPTKTETLENVPELKLFVPESLTIPLGFIVAIALAHRPKIRAGDAFVRAAFRLNNLRLFFGDDFIAALGGIGFSSRRCNKSYLQGIEHLANGESGKPKGYMLAALARSHKSGIGKLSDITETYLKDAHFSGYSPAFIIRQMFERGVFSFIPAILLEMYTDVIRIDDTTDSACAIDSDRISYANLSITSQTRLIKQLGLTASQIENIAENVKRTMIKSRKAVDDVLKIRPLIPQRIGELLQNIANGASPGKQPGFLCLMTAAGLFCPFAERDGCLGCGYEIYTKTTMYTLMREFNRLVRVKSAAKPEYACRYDLIIEQAVMPAVEEMLESAKLLYPNADISALYEITEVELDGIDSVTGSD